MAEPRTGSAHERLLDAVLGEQLAAGTLADDAARVLAASAHERAAAWRRAQREEVAAAAGPRGRRLAFAAAALLGAAVVVAAAWDRRDAAVLEQRAPVPAQDPGVRAVVPRDLAHFVELVRSARTLRVGASDIVGATNVSDATGAYDRLDVERWPEVLTIDGERLGAWQRAIAASATALERTNRLDTLLWAQFVQPDDGVLGATCSVGDEVFVDPELDRGVVVPDAALRALLQQAHAELLRARRRARGEANDAAELDALPAAATAVTCPWLPDGSLPRRLRRFDDLQRLTLARGGAPVDGAAMRALASLPSLFALDVPGDALADDDLAALATLPRLGRLTVRGGGAALNGAGLARCGALVELSLHRCRGLTAEGVRALAVARRLRTLRLDECELGGAGEVLDALPSLPALEHLVLRDASIAPRHLAPLARTKLRSLRLIDVPVTGADLAALAALPSLRELAVLAATIDDGAVDDLAALTQLDALHLQNTALSVAGLADLRRAMGHRAVQSTPGQRLFDSARWLR
jgi:hypothetical protein